jgi:hypothetical protein
LEAPRTHATIPTPGDTAVVAQVRGIDPGAWLMVFQAGAGPSEPNRSGVREENLKCIVEARSGVDGRQTIRELAFSFSRRNSPSYPAMPERQPTASAGLTDFGTGNRVHFIEAFQLPARGRIVVTCKRDRDGASQGSQAFEGGWDYGQHQLLLMSFDQFRSSR